MVSSNRKDLYLAMERHGKTDLEVQQWPRKGNESSDEEDGDSQISNGRLANERRQRFPIASVFDLKTIQKYFKQNKIKLDHAFTIWKYIVQKNCTKFDMIPTIPKIASKLLNEQCAVTTSKVVGRQDSKDGSTTKLLIELQDGRRIESVIMRYGQVELSTFPEPPQTQPKALESTSTPFRCAPRAIVCVSSQVGCGMGCSFCATGTMGLLANLTSGEILEQLYHASRIEPIRNVVFMGMGEPLDNYSEVIDAIKLMTDVRVFNLSAHRISVSTVGVVPRIKQLQHDAPDVSLALSLHAPTQKIREQIVPTAKAWNIHDIMGAAIEFVKMQKERSQRQRKCQNILLEYVLIQDINSSAEVAELLGKFLQAYMSYVILNIIPYNPTISDATMKRPTDTEIDTFISIVRSYGLRTLVRQTLGQDISGACGQLVVQSSTNQSSETPVKDLEDVLRGSCNSSTSSHIPPQQKEGTISCNVEQQSKWTCFLERLNSTSKVERIFVTSVVLGFSYFVFKRYRQR